MAASSLSATTFMSYGVSSSRPESPRLSAASCPSSSLPSIPTREKSSASVRLKNAPSSFFLAAIKFFSLAITVCSSGPKDFAAAGVCAIAGSAPAKKKTAYANQRTFMRLSLLNELPHTVLARHTRKPIDTPLILLQPVSFQALRAAMAGPAVELFALAFIVEKRDAVAAGIGNACDLDDDDRAGAVVCREVFGKRGKFRFVRLDDAAAAIQTKNIRWPLERAEHENNPAIFSQVSDGLDPAAVEIDVSDRGWPQDAERVQSFWG